MIKAVPEPKYKSLYSSLRIEYEALQLERDLLKGRVFHLSQMVLSSEAGEVVVDEGGLGVSVPKHIAEWMIEYGLPWQIFRCGDHPDHWITELDSLFPYHMEMCKCDKCQQL